MTGPAARGRWARRGFVVGLVVALAASLCANAYLASSAADYYRVISILRLDPAGLDMYAPDRAKPRSEGPLLVFFGDSRAVMWPQPSAPTGYQIVNRGIGNQTTAQILMRFDQDVMPLRPSVVVLEAGVNDLKTIAEFPDKRGRIVADCEANLARIVERCRSAGATVVLVKVFGIGHIPFWRRPFWSDDVRTAVREVNAFLATLQGERVVLFDANTVLGDGGEDIKAAYQMDYLHLTSAGYAALNQSLAPLLSSLPK